VGHTLPIRRIEDRFEGAAGRRLFRRAWLPAEPLRVMLLVHGFGEHSGRYEEMAVWWAERGFAVHAYDHQGHGESPGPRGHADRFEDLLDDLEAFIAMVAASHVDLSRILVGHSMGGLLVTALACERAPAIDLLVTSGPALSISPDLSPLKMWLARMLGRIWPTLGMNAGLDASAISRDPDVVSRYLDDPLVHGRMTAGLGAGMLAAVRRSAASAASVRVPLLMLHGEADRLCLPSGSQAFYAGLPHDEVAGSRIHTYPNLMHEIFNEPEREQVWIDLLAWLDEQGSSRPAA
jgi:alpha-beta hydrolase superfamily lysophospholipase